MSIADRLRKADLTEVPQPPVSICLEVKCPAGPSAALKAVQQLASGLHCISKFPLLQLSNVCRGSCGPADKAGYVCTRGFANSFGCLSKKQILSA